MKNTTRIFSEPDYPWNSA